MDSSRLVKRIPIVYSLPVNSMPLRQLPPSESPLPLEAGIRCSLRDIFLAVTLAAASLAVVAPWFRSWDDERRAAFLCVWCSTALGAGLRFAMRLIPRLGVKRSPALLRFRLRHTVFTRLGLVLCIGLWLSTPALLTWYEWSFSPSDTGSRFVRSWVWSLLAFLFGLNLDIARFSLSWQCMEFCDDGIVIGMNDMTVLPWQDLRSFRWGANDPCLLVLQSKWSIITVPINRIDKPEIERFLTSRITAMH